MTTKDPTRIVDLDAAREARAARLGEPAVLRFGGEDYPLPAELPAAFLEFITADRLGDAMAVLLGEDAAAAFMAGRPTIPDLEAFAEGISEVYGVSGGLGNSLASGS